MELSERTNWYLSAMELTLCLRILGQAERTILPVAESEQPLAHRMLDGFLHLAEIGLLEGANGAYRPTALLKARLLPAAEPERSLILPDGKAPLAVYFRGGAATVIEATGENGQSCRISAPEPEALAELLEERLRENLALRPTLELRDAEGKPLEWLRFSEDGAEGTEALAPDALRRLLRTEE